MAANLDYSLVTQILQNLLSKAVKYNDEKDLWARIRASCDEATITMEISKWGRGNSQGSSGWDIRSFRLRGLCQEPGVDGFGLGLNLFREFSRTQGGETELIGWESGETRFWLTLPKSN